MLKNRPDDLKLTIEYLDERSYKTQNAGYPEPKWITFSRIMLILSFDVYLHEAHESRSKYLRIAKRNQTEIYKVRFSNHIPCYTRDKNTFFVGISRLGTSTYRDAILATLKFFGVDIDAARKEYKQALTENRK